MKRYLWIALAAMVGWGALAPPTHAATPQLHNFYGVHKEIRDKHAFTETLRSHSLKVDRVKLVTLYNQQYGRQLGEVPDFDQLTQMLSSDAFVVLPCTGTLFAFGMYDTGHFQSFPRGCYDGELVLVHRRTHARVFSLLCGNLLLSPPLAYIPPPRHYQPGEVVYTDKCGYWILYGCLDQQRITRGHSSILPQHD